MEKLTPPNSLVGLEVSTMLKERRTVADIISVSLREGIRTGLLKDGDELSQVGIAKHFGVSRVPVREALRAIEAEGWIEAPTNHRAFVRALSLDEVGEIFDLRELIEINLVSRLIGMITAAQIRALNQLCDEMDQISGHCDWVAANGVFHKTLLETSERQHSVNVVQHLSSQIERYLRLTNAGPERHIEANAEHRLILSAIAKGDGDTACNLLRKHIRSTRELTLNSLISSRAFNKSNLLEE